MLLLAGSNDAVSFTDDTSPDTRNTKKRNVSIHAKVRRESPLDWYYQLIYLCRNIKGELKSKNVIDAFKSMPGSERKKLWNTLKEVQINITDPLPYQVETNKSISRVMKKENAVEFIRQKANAKDPHAIKLLELLNNSTAESILFDAPSRRLSWNLYFAENPIALYADEKHKNMFPALPNHKVDISRLKSSNPKSIIRAATEWTAKSASVFSDAIDASQSPRYRFYGHPALNPVAKALKQSHAFDRGNEKYIDLMEDERKKFLNRMSRTLFRLRESYFKPLQGNLDSEKSFFIQASDLAAGITSHLFESGGIFSITTHFEYVMFNGKRISQNDAYETMRKWQELGYYNN